VVQTKEEQGVQNPKKVDGADLKESCNQHCGQDCSSQERENEQSSSYGLTFSF
jgi:hypothetical protein